MVQQLRALIAVAEDRVQFPAPTEWLTTVTSVPGTPMSFSGPHRLLYAHGAHKPT